MKTAILLNETIDKGVKMSDPLEHFFVALLFIAIIAFAIAVIFFAKWLVLGPWFRKKWNKITGSNKEKVEGVKVVNGEVVVDEEYISDIDKKIAAAETPQELLEAQLLKEKVEKERIRLNDEQKEKENKKLEKQNAKSEKARVRAEMKQQEKEYKEKQKQEKGKKKGK